MASLKIWEEHRAGAHVEESHTRVSCDQRRTKGDGSTSTHLNQLRSFSLARARFLVLALLRSSHIAAALWSKVHCLAVLTAFSASSSLSERSLTSLRTKPASSTTLVGSCNKRPFKPSIMISLTPEFMLAMTGKPLAIASITGRP